MRIVIVEDEYRIRKCFVKLINKINPEYEIVGEAENGLEGIEMIMTKRPDLVFADIRMPLINGIDMLTKLKEKGVRHKTIILSGYSDFEYAKKAIKLGAYDYLLKPVAVDELKQALLSIEKELDLEELPRGGQPIQSLEDIMENLTINNSKENLSIYKYLFDNYKIDSNGNFALAIVYFGDCNEYLKRNIRNNLSILIQSFIKTGFCIFESTQNNEFIILLYNCDDYSKLEKYFQDVIIREFQYRINHETIFAWTSFNYLDNMNKYINILRNELKWSIILGNDVLISYPKTQKINTKSIQYPIDLQTEAKVAVFSFDFEKLEKIFNDFLSWWQGKLCQPSEVIEATIRFASSIVNVIRELDFRLYEKFSQIDLLQGIMNSITWSELKQSLFEIIEKAIESTKYTEKDKVMSLVVKKAISYVDEFYKDGITLEQIANKLNITPEYLGSIFNKEVGMNFSTYIKEFRIKKAKELLISKELKIYEIAEKVGYTDPKYFCRVFKQTTGLTTGEFQRANK